MHTLIRFSFAFFDYICSIFQNQKYLVNENVLLLIEFLITVIKVIGPDVFIVYKYSMRGVTIGTVGGQVSRN